MPTGTLSSNAQEWPSRGQSFDARRSAGKSSFGTVARNFESTCGKGDPGNSLKLAHLRGDGQSFYASITGLDLSLPRTSFSVSYFPTIFERTRLIGSSDMEAEKDELSDLFSLKSEDSATSSFFDGSTSELTASIVRSGSSSNETNTASDSSDTESTISLDDNFVKSVIGSDRGIDVRERILEESIIFRNAFNSLVAQFGNENDTAEDFGLSEVRNRPLGVLYPRRRRSSRRSASFDSL
ncbi:hypothetical protein VTN96DRAFT_4506 [Rasamsonia emersonii]